MILFILSMFVVASKFAVFLLYLFALAGFSSIPFGLVILAIIQLLFSLIVAVIFIVLAANREKEEDKKHEEEYRRRMGL